MQRLISSDLWSAIKRAANQSRRRFGAIAYVTEELVRFRPGDVLVVDASPAAIASGATDASLLARLERRRVEVYSHPGLHAKVLLFDRCAFIGSSNMSAASQSALLEAGLLTDSKATLSQVESFIAQLVVRSQRLDRGSIRELSRIEVKRRVGPWFRVSRPRSKITVLGNNTWLVGVTEADRPWTADEQEALDRAEQAICRKYGIRKHCISWIRWGHSGRFVNDGRNGDRMIQIWSSTRKARPSFVHRAAAVLHLAKIGRFTFVSIAEPKGRCPRVRWGAFKKLMDQIGNRRRFGGNSERILDPEFAEAIDRLWGRA